MLEILPLTTGFGAEVRNIGGLVRAIAETLRSALIAHHLVIVRARTLTPEGQIAFARMFGTPEVWGRHAQIAKYPEIHRVTNQPGDGHHDVGRYWHSDGTFLDVPPAISIWHVVRHPEEGGDTLFADMHRAYDELPPDLKARTAGLRMIASTGAAHPVIRIHPVTGRKALYTSIRNTKGFEGLNAEEVEDLLARFDRHLDRPGGHYRHQWREGDIVIGDNISVAHKATLTDPRYPRALHRVSVRGDEAYFAAARGWLKQPAGAAPAVTPFSAHR